MLFDSSHMVRCKLHGSQLFVWSGRRKVCKICTLDAAVKA